ncbi:MAG TPA: biotin/lipoyl-binding protein, partial [Bacteroidales bacterium]
MSVLKKIKGVQSRLIYEILFGSILLMFSIWGLSIYFHVGDTVYTDDAQVEENVNPVNARIPGYIREVRFNEHETVRAGDTIIIIDDKEYKIALQKAIASLEAAKANNAVAQSDLGVAHVGISISEANL